MTEVQSGNLVDGTATVTFTDRFGYVQVENHDGSSGLWVTTDGTDAVVGGDDVDCVPPGTTALLANGLPVWYPGYEAPNPGTTINLASTSQTAAYSLQGAG